jgi:hypothetical protein
VQSGTFPGSHDLSVFSIALLTPVSFETTRKTIRIEYKIDAVRQSGSKQVKAICMPIVCSPAIPDLVEAQSATGIETEDQACTVTNAHQPAVRFKLFSQVAVGMLTDSVASRGTNAGRCRRILLPDKFPIRNKSCLDRCCMAEF